jgi:Leucine-rich repeat (LRR) protein
MAAGIWTAQAAEPPHADIVERVEAQGGFVVRDSGGAIVEVSLARTWAADLDVERVAQITGLRKLDLSFTYVTDRGIEHLRGLRNLEELRLDTAEFITDSAASYLRGNQGLRRLVLRGTDITDVGMPYLAELTGLRSLDLSFTMLGDVGLESLPALTELQELRLGGDRITGINLSFLKLLPNLEKLSFHGIQRRNASACWSPLITDLDLDAISLLSGLEELDLGIGISLGMGGEPAAPGGGNCRVAGGIQVSDLGIAKLAKLKNLKQLDVSGAQLTPAGIAALRQLPLERLNVWNCPALDDSAAKMLAAIPTLANLDLSYTSIGDEGLRSLAKLPRLEALYLTETKVTSEAVEAFRRQKPECFLSWARRPAPRVTPEGQDLAPKTGADSK